MTTIVLLHKEIRQNPGQVKTVKTIQFLGFSGVLWLNLGHCPIHAPEGLKSALVRALC